MNVMDTLLKRRKVVKTTIEIEEEEIEDKGDEVLKHDLKQTIEDLNLRVLELETQVYGRK